LAAIITAGKVTSMCLRMYVRFGSLFFWSI
jgi:hypothetical protein